MNHVVLSGNLTATPEIKDLGDGKRVVNFTIASNRIFKDNANEKKKEATFVRCEAWDSGAQRIVEGFQKGDPICVEGQLRGGNWDPETEKKYDLKIRVQQFLPVSRFKKSEAQ